MKKIIIIVLCVMILATLCSCNLVDPADTPDGSQNQSVIVNNYICGDCNQSHSTHGNSSYSNITDNTHSNPNNSSDTEESVSLSGDFIENGCAVNNIVLYHNNGVKVTATSINWNGLFGPEIKCIIENNSIKNVTVSTRNEAINGYMSDMSGLYADVTVGNKAVETFTLWEVDLEESNINKVENVQFIIALIDSDTYDTIEETGVINLYVNQK